MSALTFITPKALMVPLIALKCHLKCGPFITQHASLFLIVKEYCD